MIFEDIREYIIGPSLRLTGLYSQSAELLLAGTFAIETNGECLMQKDAINDGAFGIFQIESTTHYDIRKWLKDKSRKPLLDRILSASYMEILPPDDEVLVYNLRYATLIARIVYYRHNEALPFPDDIKGLVNYYLKYYNTNKGKATFDKCIGPFKKICSY